MEGRRKAPHLQLVLPPANDTATRKPEQLSFFPEGERVLLGIVNVDRIRGSQFEAMLRDMRPKWLIDLRVVPHFSIDRLNRRYVFSIFKECLIDYRDMMTSLDIRSRHDASLSSGRIANEVTQVLAAAGGNTVLGSIIFLVDDDDVARMSANMFQERLQPRPKGGWDMRFLTPLSQPASPQSKSSQSA